ncbi:hypothetical protein CMMCAS07_17065 [Clavibacter michiganensis subsp. michiganensis]|uniref:Uncharacterized protein n=1 Tax=Clavibacter michiganensis subsp. michiganensis TaxID=33013 RepID=A0A251XEC6_CLAMM|nr:hypothetical protein CMMCAS07_17065 [Clavibacter michiganensis subsp. michiganensis]
MGHWRLASSHCSPDPREKQHDPTGTHTNQESPSRAAAADQRPSAVASSRSTSARTSDSQASPAAFGCRGTSPALPPSPATYGSPASPAHAPCAAVGVSWSTNRACALPPAARRRDPRPRRGGGVRRHEDAYGLAWGSGRGPLEAREAVEQRADRDHAVHGPLRLGREGTEAEHRRRPVEETGGLQHRGVDGEDAAGSDEAHGPVVDAGGAPEEGLQIPEGEGVPEGEGGRHGVSKLLDAPVRSAGRPAARGRTRQAEDP